MTGLLRAALIAVLIAVAPAPVFAEASLNAYEASRAALLAVWEELPLTIRNVALTEGAPAGYGDYVVHEGNSFRPGETIHIYAEVLGYGWRDNGDGTVSKLLDADLALVDASGATVASKPGFVTTDVKSREKLLESDLAFNVTLTAFQPGVDPVLLGAFVDRALVGVAFDRGAFHTDPDPPARVVQALDRHALVVLPLAVALREVPLLQPLKRRRPVGHG